MNALEALIVVMVMLLVTTLKGVTLAPVTLDTQAVDLLALVSSFDCSNSINYTHLIHNVV